VGTLIPTYVNLPGVRVDILKIRASIPREEWEQEFTVSGFSPSLLFPDDPPRFLQDRFHLRNLVNRLLILQKITACLSGPRVSPFADPGISSALAVRLSSVVFTNFSKNPYMRWDNDSSTRIVPMACPEKGDGAERPKKRRKG